MKEIYTRISMRSGAKRLMRPNATGSARGSEPRSVSAKMSMEVSMPLPSCWSIT